MPSDKDLLDISNFLKTKNISIESLKDLLSVLSEKNNDSTYRSVSTTDLELKVNENQQYARNWSIRLHNVPVPTDLISQAGEDMACMHTAYKKVIYPVLATLVVDPDNWRPGLLTEVPNCLTLLSNAHHVGKEIEGKPRTIIVRFISRYFRNLFLKQKFDKMPQPSLAEVAQGIQFYAAYPDLTSRNHRYLMDLKKEERVKSAWAFDGHIKFTLKTDRAFAAAAANPVKPKVYRVEDIRVSPAVCVDQATDNKSTDRRSRIDSVYDRRHTRSFVAGQSNAEPTKHAGNSGAVGRGSQSGGRDGFSGVRGGYSGGRGGYSGGRGGQSGGRGGQGRGRGGQPGGRGGVPRGRGGAAGGSGGTRIRSPAPSRSPIDRWHTAKNGPISTQDKFKGEPISGQLPTDQDILSNKFNSVNLNEQF